MKNIEKKWMLFLIATFVTSFGIGYTLLKETFATDNLDNSSQVVDTNNNLNDDIPLEEDGDVLFYGEQGCQVTGLVLSEGELEFQPDIFEYNISVGDLSKISVVPFCGLLEAPSYSVTKEKVAEDKLQFSVVIYQNDEEITYTVNVTEIEETPIDDVVIEEKRNDYTYKFIAIICVLVFINIYRIVKNKRSK